MTKDTSMEAKRLAEREGMVLVPRLDVQYLASTGDCTITGTVGQAADYGYTAYSHVRKWLAATSGTNDDQRGATVVAEGSAGAYIGAETRPEGTGLAGVKTREPVPMEQIAPLQQAAPSGATQEAAGAGSVSAMETTALQVAPAPAAPSTLTAREAVEAAYEYFSQPPIKACWEYNDDMKAKLADALRTLRDSLPQPAKGGR